MMTRSHDPERLNELVNHPAVRPDVGGDGESHLDLAAVLADEQNVLLLGPAGGFLATWTAPETYEIHTFILPDGRGPQAFDLARQGKAWMTEHGATHLWTRVNRQHRHTRLFTLKAGFKPCGEQTLDLGGGPVLYDLYNWRP